MKRRLSPDGPQPNLRAEIRGPDERADEIDSFPGWTARVAGEDDLLPDEHRAVTRLRQLDRPAVARAMAETDAPPRQAKVVGVEVRRRDSEGRLGLDADIRRDVREVGQSKRRRHDARHQEIASVHRDVPAHDVAIGTEVFLPESIAQDHDIRFSAIVLHAEQRAPEQRLNSKHFEKFG